MGLNLLKKIGASSIIVVIIPNEKYNQYITEIAKEVSKAYDATCYVSLNKLYSALLRNMKSSKVNDKKFFFIDGITKSVQPTPDEFDNCVYVTSSAALTELSLGLSSALSTNHFNCLLFDSLSTLLIYNKSDVVTQFVHDQMGKVMNANCVAIFTCLEGDTKSDLIKNLGMFVDQIIHLGDIDKKSKKGAK
ncbi:MAG: hypothetical protein KAQ83_03125 [Nanoarchaeota archaeon]|nr:hypothetical protein [Nanoarchaeota archaeon]